MPTSIYFLPPFPLFHCIDGTTNFAHGYPSFAVSVGVLFRGKPTAASVVSNGGLHAIYSLP